MHFYMGFSIKKSTTTCLLLICLLFFSAEVTEALKCYQCGSYPRGGGTGSISPCSDRDEKNVMTCSPLDKLCLKYVNKKMVVRQCSEKCEDDKNSHEEEYHCCKDDLCNGGVAIEPRAFSVILTAIFTLGLAFRA